ncbi:MAG: MATE family efflux transporter [Granulosicoccaceae bacterium]
MAIPIILSNSTVPLVGIVDTAVMGRMDSPAFVSAAGIGAVMFSSILWVFGFLRMATGGLVAQAHGAANPLQAERTGLRALLLALLLGLILILASEYLLWLGLALMESSERVHTLVADYYRIRIWSAPATLMTYALSGTLIGQQRMRAIFSLQLILNVTNIGLNLGFFNYTDWGIRGVATATVISEYIALAAALSMSGTLSAIRRNNAAAGNPVKSWIADPARLMEFLQISGDLFIRTLCLTAAFYWLTVMGSKQGDDILAANILLINMLHFMAYALDGFSHAAETLTGFALGQGNRRALSSAVNASTIWAGVFALAFIALFALAGGPIIDAMTTQEPLREMTRQWLPWIIFSPLIAVWSFLLDGIFIGTTHTRAMRNGMLISSAVFVIASIVLVQYYNNHGLWLAYYILMIMRTITLGVKYPAVLRSAEARTK